MFDGALWSWRTADCSDLGWSHQCHPVIFFSQDLLGFFLLFIKEVWGFWKVPKIFLVLYLLQLFPIHLVFEDVLHKNILLLFKSSVLPDVDDDDCRFWRRREVDLRVRPRRPVALFHLNSSLFLLILWSLSPASSSNRDYVECNVQEEQASNNDHHQFGP